MACNVWEEMGLLYSSNELDDRERTTFLSHIKECAECSREREIYEYEKATYFTDKILQEAPSAACDAEILRVCAEGRKRIINVNLIALFFKKSVVSVALFLLAFIFVGYLTLRTDPSINQNNTANPTKKSDNSMQYSNNQNEAAGTLQQDSLADTSQKSSVNYANQRGNMNLKGVYPVDLQNK